jgi:hypothetical protein
LLIINSITRDNASSNNTLLKAFKKHYSKESIKFQGNIAYLAYILNLVMQDILKAIIKDAYKDFNNNNININKKESNLEEVIIIDNKFNKSNLLYIYNTNYVNK